MSNRWAWGIKITLTAGILGYLFFQVDWAQLGAEFAKTKPWWYALAILITLCGMILTAFRWRWLLRIQGIPLTLRKAFSLTFIGMFFNAFFLGTTGGDITKLYYITKEAPDRKARAVLSVVMDRAIGLFALLFIGLLTLPFKARVLWQDDDTRLLSLTLLSLFAIGLAGLLFVFLTPFQKAPQSFKNLWAKVPGNEIVATMIEGIKQHGRSARLTFAAFSLSLLLQFFLLLGGWFLAFALEIPVSLVTIMIILVIVQVAISLPISIGGHGVREGVVIVLFMAFGIIGQEDSAVGTETAIAFSILFFSLQLFCSLVGGVVYLFRKDRSPTSQDPQLSSPS